jgi:hypothetical protein
VIVIWDCCDLRFKFGVIFKKDTVDSLMRYFEHEQEIIIDGLYSFGDTVKDLTFGMFFLHIGHIIVD